MNKLNQDSYGAINASNKTIVEMEMNVADQDEDEDEDAFKIMNKQYELHMKMNTFSSLYYYYK